MIIMMIIDIYISEITRIIRLNVSLKETNKLFAEDL